ncbi:hypothetical protein RUE5091_02958 [Ruegeria denitrificans]|uniref:Sulfotransferase domain protein n=1 Tax=Ruegeria denitrificans TaxID=1715692 RepID=A0A0P1IDZ4_9RHOB|nr:hypothetical protein RUE5091_02958 [Ruegeria denitrificans]
MGKLPELIEGTTAFVDKAPGNYAFLGEVAQAFPKAVILNVLRDPRDVVLSMWRASFSAGGLYYTLDLKWMAAEANRYRRRSWPGLAICPLRTQYFHRTNLRMRSKRSVTCRRASRSIPLLSEGGRR